MKRVALYILLPALAGVLLLGVVLWWIFGTTSGAAWVLRTLPRTPLLSLTVHRVEGRLLDRLVLSGVRLVSGKRESAVQRLELHWRPVALISGALDVEKLSLSGVRIEDRTPERKEAIDLSWPRLPGVELFEGRIGELSITDVTYRRLQEPEVKINALSASLSWRHTLLSISDLRVRSPEGRLAGKLVAGLKRPSLQLDLIMDPARPLAGMERISVQARLKPAKGTEQVAGPASVVGERGEARLLSVAGVVGITRNAINLRGVRIEKKGQTGTAVVDGTLDLSREEPQAALQVQGRNLDLSPQLKRPTNLSGTVTIAGRPERYRGRFTLSNRGRGWETLSLSGAFLGGKQGVRLSPFNARVLRGTLAGAVDVAWDAPVTVRAELAARGLRPEILSPKWRGVVNFDAEGEASWPRGEARRWRVGGRILQSTVRGKRLTGEVQAHAADGDVTLRRLFLHGEGVDLSAAGRLSRRVEVEVAVDDLSLLTPAAQGEMQGKGWLRYRRGRLAGELSGSGRRLAFGGVSADDARFSAALSDAAGSPLHLAAALRQVILGPVVAQTGTLRITGSAASHEARLFLCSPMADATLAGRGSYRGGTWRGTITEFSGRDEVGPWGLAAPATLAVDAHGYTMTPLLLRGKGEEFLSLSAAVAKPRLGGVSANWGSLNLSRVNSWVDAVQFAGVSDGELELSFLRNGRVDIRGNARGQGTFATEEHVLEVKSALVNLDGGERGVTAQMELHLLQGVVQGRFSSPAAARLGIPMEGDVAAQWANLDLKELEPWFPPGLRVEGRVAGQVAGRLLPGKVLDLSGTTSLAGGIVHWRNGDEELDAALERSEISLTWLGGFLPEDRRGAKIGVSAHATGAGSYTKGGRRLTVSRGSVGVDAGAGGTRARVEVVPEGRGVVKGIFVSDRPASFELPETGDFQVSVSGLDPRVIQPWLPGAVNLEGELSGEVAGRLLPERRVEMEGEALFSGGVAGWHGGGGEMRANLRAASLDFAWKGERLTGDLALSLSDAGEAKGNFSLPLPARFPASFDQEGRVSAALKGKLQERGVLSAFLPGMVRESHGDLDLDFTVGGVWKDPLVQGRGNLARGGGYLPPLGITLSDVTLALRLDGNVIRIDTLRARSGRGAIDAVLQAEMDGGRLSRYRGTIKGENFQVFHLPELRVLASPQLNFAGNDKELVLRGEVLIPELQVLGPPPHEAVSPSSDVVIEGAPEEPGRVLPVALDVRVRVVLGENVEVKTEGIDAKLGGGMEVFFTSLDKIRSSGEIKVVKGRYRAYGLDLDIVRGRIYYAGGAIDQPTLDILALRSISDVKAGVTVGGIVREPVVKLYSEPAMPDVDILAYMVLGHPLGSSSAEQGSLVAQAAGVLFSTGETGSLQEQIKSRLGLSTLEMQTASPETTGRMGYQAIPVTPSGAPAKTAPISQSMLTVGKYLTPRLYFSYGRSLFTGSSLFTLRYDITRHWQIESQTGTESGLDMYYKIEFK